MYCVHCGAEQAANFCRKCGKSQVVSSDHSSNRQDEQIVHATPGILQNDWVGRLDYNHLLRNDEPRRRIAVASTKSKPGVTGDDVLALLEAVSPAKISLSKLTHAIVPIVDKLGIRTTNQSQAVWQADAGRVLLATLCSLASRSLEVTEVEQEVDTCVLTSRIPLGIITNPGKVVIKLESNSGWIRATLVVTISGQWYDWGKSKRLIEELLAGINADLNDQNAGRTVAFTRVA